MRTNRLLFLLIVLIFGLGAVFLLPSSAQTEPVGIKLELPQYVGKWYGTDQQITERERQVLASDTEFARKVYTDGAGNEVYASIVLSGHDLDNSIHRPERCLPAQGWTIVDSRRRNITLPNGGKLEVTRLRNVQQLRLRDGKQIPIHSLDYYWFIGYRHLTASHIERTFLDIRDRILKGYNQRWAYVTVASTITNGLVQFGATEEQTDRMIQDFIVGLLPSIIDSEPGQQVARKSETPAKPSQL
jgi:EpsI family protein